MKLNFIDPNQILSVILALIVLGVGVFASFTVFANIPTKSPIGSNLRTGNATWTQTPTAPNLQTYSGNATTRWIPTPNYLNNTAVCIVWGLTTTRGTATIPHWIIVQTVGAVNGTFVTNATGVQSLRYTQTAQLGPHINANLTFRVEYPLTNQQTTTLQNTTYQSVINVSKTSVQVFNIIGVVMIIAAIMSIIGVIYSYIKPRM